MTSPPCTRHRPCFTDCAGRLHEYANPHAARRRFAPMSPMRRFTSSGQMLPSALPPLRRRPFSEKRRASVALCTQPYIPREPSPERAYRSRSPRALSFKITKPVAGTGSVRRRRFQCRARFGALAPQDVRAACPDRLRTWCPPAQRRADSRSSDRGRDLPECRDG